MSNKSLKFFLLKLSAQSRAAVKQPRALAALSAVVASTALLASAQVLAHHSFAAFNMTQEVDVQGTVKSFLWTNPHSLLVVTAPGPDGNIVDMYVEMNGPGYLAPKGWKRDSLKVGDKVTLTLHPMRDGAPGGDLVKVVFADGRPGLSAQIGPARPAAGQSSSAAAPAPPSEK